MQGESLLSALHMYRLTGDAQYWTYFSQILGWIVDEQVDWEHGEWIEQVEEDGTRRSTTTDGRWWRVSVCCGNWRRRWLARRTEE